MSLFETCKPLIGVVHLPPLPGTPGYKSRKFPPRLGRLWSIEDIVEYGISESRIYEESGFDAIIVENYGDTPYGSKPAPAQIASMTRVVHEITKAVTIPVGVHFVGRAGWVALSVAYPSGASFIRAAVCEARNGSLGIVSDEAIRLATTLSSLGLYPESSNQKITILADLSIPQTTTQIEASLATSTESCIDLSGIPIDGLILTGPSTGGPPDVDTVTTVRRVAEEKGVRLLVGSGISQLNLAKFWNIADGFIVGSSVKLGGEAWNPIDKEKARLIASLARSMKKTTPECGGVY